MPAMKLKVTTVTTSQPSQRVSAACTRRRSAKPRANQRPATPSTSAAGSSQAIWLPISESNIRQGPVSPQPPPPPTEPVSLPVSRPRPL